MHAASVGFQCPDCVAAGRAGQRAVRTRFGGRVHGRAPAATYALIGVNVAVFLATVASGAGVQLGFSGQSSLYDQFALRPLFVANGEYYRLITSAFLHFGLLHIAFNMYALYVVGPPLERALGRVRFLLLYLLAGLGGAAASYAFASPVETAAGASGAIFGLFGAYYVIARRVGAQTGAILMTIVLNLVITFTIPNIDWRAHVGGLIAGSVIAAGFAYAPRLQRLLVQSAGVAVVAAAVAVMTLLRTHDLQPLVDQLRGYLG